MASSKHIHYWVLFILLSACSGENELKPFSSDGCSLFPDSSSMANIDWCSCCFAHDVAYWRGGTSEQRLNADNQLRLCVLDKTQNEALATLMYEGVRFGGSPYFSNWYRWGYGWSYERKYQKLSTQENELADSFYNDYLISEKKSVCQ